MRRLLPREKRRVSRPLLRRLCAGIASAAKSSAKSGAKRLILGAWGCGAFRSDPAVAARLLAKALADGPGAGTEDGV